MWTKCCLRENNRACGPLPRELKQRRRHTETIHKQKVGQLPKHAGKWWSPPVSLANWGHADTCGRGVLESSPSSSHQRQEVNFLFVWRWLALIPEPRPALKCSGTNKNHWNAMKCFSSVACFFVCKFPEAIWDKISWNWKSLLLHVSRGQLMGHHRPKMCRVD